MSKKCFAELNSESHSNEDLKDINETASQILNVLCILISTS
jgi:hypothetical protein